MFDAIDRRNTHAIKVERYKDRDVIPMWVADMDLATAPPVQQVLEHRVKHPVYGYAHPWQSLNQAVVDWCAVEYEWTIETDWIVWMPGVVPSFNLAIAAFGRQGRVIVQEPNYPPLRAAPGLRHCTPVRLPIQFRGKRWFWDWEHLERELAHPDCHLMVLSNPMNPHGTVLTEADVQRLGEMCIDHRVLLCSDEIHCDLVLDTGIVHCPASRPDVLKTNSLTLMAASKTFNIAGLACSFAVIPDSQLRQTFRDAGADLIPEPNILGYAAAEAAFRSGKPWLSELRAHLRRNRARVSAVINTLPGLSYRPQGATFLAWIESDLPAGEAMSHFVKAGVMPSDGMDFGDPTAVRLNFGTDADTLEQAMRRLERYWRQNMPSSS